ncbi:MAG: exosortase C-terminal domain/associated protein EpsI [Syntrophales bacterium]
MSTRRAMIVTVLLALSTSLYVNVFLNRGEASVPREPLASFPVSIDGWDGKDQLFPSRILENLGVDEYLVRNFTKGKDSIWLYIGYYRNQKEGAVPHSPRHCYPGTGFNPIRHDVITIPVNHGGKESIRPNRYVFARGQEREVVIYWYQSRGRVIADEYVEKMYLIRDAIFRNRSDGALVRFSIGATAETVEARGKLLERFVSRTYPQIPRVVPD